MIKSNSKIKTTLELLQHTNKRDGLGQLCQQSLRIIKLQLQGEVTRDTLSSLFPEREHAPAFFILAECTFHQSWYLSDFSTSQFMAEPGRQLIQWKKVDIFLFD